MRDLDWNLLDRCLAGDATADDRARFERWVAEHSANEEFAAAWPRVLELLGRDLSTAERETLWAAAVPARSARPWWIGLTRIAAAVLLVVGAALAGRAILGGRSGAHPSEMQVVTAPLGQRLNFRLADGTNVILSAGSTLRHHAFDGGPRDVTLDGEAYFEVVHDPAHPFVVHARDIIAKDLGTEFVVRAYSEDRHAHVVVREGSVAIGPVTGTAPFEPVRAGQRGHLSPTGAAVVEAADTAGAFAWTEGRLVFSRTPLGDALPQLGRWYNLEFRLADSTLAAIPLVATFRGDLTDSRLHLLAVSLGVREVRQGRIVTFYPASTENRHGS